MLDAFSGCPNRPPSLLSNEPCEVTLVGLKLVAFLDRKKWPELVINRIVVVMLLTLIAYLTTTSADAAKRKKYSIKQLEAERNDFDR